MTLATDFLRLFTEGWTEYLAGADLGLTWAASGALDPADVNLFLMAAPTDPSFDASTVAVLSPYPLADDPNFADSTVGLQVKLRSGGEDPRVIWALDDQIANVILGNYPLDLPGGAHVSTILGRTSSSLGRDDKDRWTWQSSYPCKVLRPGAHRS